jgi:hypothetical protein
MGASHVDAHCGCWEPLFLAGRWLPYWEELGPNHHMRPEAARWILDRAAVRENAVLEVYGLPGARMGDAFVPRALLDVPHRIRSASYRKARRDEPFGVAPRVTNAVVWMIAAFANSASSAGNLAPAKTHSALPASSKASIAVVRPDKAANVSHKLASG